MLGYLAKHAIEIGARLFGHDLSGHVDEALRLRGIVGRRFGLAGHGRRVTRMDDDGKSGQLVLCSEEELERCTAIFEVHYVDGVRVCVGPRKGKNAESLPQPLVQAADN